MLLVYVVFQALGHHDRAPHWLEGIHILRNSTTKLNTNADKAPPAPETVDSFEGNSTLSFSVLQFIMQTWNHLIGTYTRGAHRFYHPRRQTSPNKACRTCYPSPSNPSSYPIHTQIPREIRDSLPFLLLSFLLITEPRKAASLKDEQQTVRCKFVVIVCYNLWPSLIYT